MKPVLQPTGCCAFTQLRADNDTTPEQLDSLLAQHARDVKREWGGEEHMHDLAEVWEEVQGFLGLGGAPTLWAAVVMPFESSLFRMLQDRGFYLMKFIPRRNGYGRGEIAIMVKEFEPSTKRGMRKGGGGK